MSIGSSITQSLAFALHRELFIYEVRLCGLRLWVAGCWLSVLNLRCLMHAWRFMDHGLSSCVMGRLDRPYGHRPWGPGPGPGPPGTGLGRTPLAMRTTAARKRTQDLFCKPWAINNTCQLINLRMQINVGPRDPHLALEPKTK